MSPTQAVAGINSLNSKSLESSDSVQQKKRRGPSEPRKQQDESVASTVPHQSDLSDFTASASPKYSFPM